MTVRLYSTSFLIFLSLDMLWLGFLGRNFYRNQIGFLMKSDINWAAAIIFYLIFIFGLVTFVVIPALKNHSLAYAAIYGALFGLVTYATYDLTNLATLKDWPLPLTIVDLIWGTLLSSAVGTLTFLLSNKN